MIITPDLKNYVYTIIEEWTNRNNDFLREVICSRVRHVRGNFLLTSFLLLMKSKYYFRPEASIDLEFTSNGIRVEVEYKSPASKRAIY